MIKIEKDAPFQKKRGRPKKYPFSEMDIGDSFVIDGKKGVSMFGSARCQGVKITIRSIGDGKIRVWRVG